MYVWRRDTRDPKSTWQRVGDTCDPQRDAPKAAPPPVPTFGQIQDAFRKLPFAKPTVRVQPVGNITLVNLPTYYEAVWPRTGLGPGDVSKPVQLLSWRVEFKVELESYDYRFGDGESSGAVTSAGGPYPDGDVQHVYLERSTAAPVHVDATLSGQYRVNGGAWQDIQAVADLQDEPVTTVQVKEAHARLYAN